MVYSLAERTRTPNMLKRILFITLGVLLLGGVVLAGARIFLGSRTSESPEGALSPEEVNEEPLISGSGEDNTPLLNPSPGTNITMSGGSSSGTVGLQAHAVCPTNWTTTDTDGDGLPDTIEERYRTDPKKADTDGDGFLDGDEVRNGYDPTKAGSVRLDSDGDGLLDHEECQWKTDPFARDSDGDGFTDGEEVKNGFDPTIKGDGRGSDALPSRRAATAANGFDRLRPDPNSTNYTEGLTGVLLGDRPATDAGSVQVTQEKVEQILANAKLNTNLPDIKLTQLTVQKTNNSADIRVYTERITQLRPSELTSASGFSTALSSAIAGNPRPLQDLRGKLGQYAQSLLTLPTPPSAVEHHVLLVALLQFVNDRLGVIERSGGSDPARAYVAARELQEALSTNLPRLQTLRANIDILAAR